MFILKQINLIQKSDTNDALRTQELTSASFADSGNIYEFLMENTYIKYDNEEDKLNPYYISYITRHDSNHMDPNLLTFIYTHMIKTNQPSVTFSAEVKVDLGNYLLTQMGVYAVQSLAALGEFEVDKHFSYKPIIKGNILVIENDNIRSTYRNGIFNADYEEVGDNDISGNSIKLRGCFGSTDNDTVYNVKNIKIVNPDEDWYNAARNTYDYQPKIDEVIDIGVSLAGLDLPIANNEESQWDDYNMNWLRSTYEYTQESENQLREISNAAEHITQYFRDIKSTSKSGDRMVMATNNGKTTWINGYDKYESIIFRHFEMEASEGVNKDFYINLNKSLARSSYSYIDADGSIAYLPLSVVTMTYVDLKGDKQYYQNSNLGSLYYISISKIQNLHAEMLKNITSTTTSGDDNGVKNPTPDVVPTNTDALNAIKERLEYLDYTIIDDNKIVPKCMIVQVPFTHTNSNLSIIAGENIKDVIARYGCSAEEFCSENKCNRLKYSGNEKTYVGQILRIPTSHENLMASENVIMAQAAGTSKVPNAVYCPAESAYETYENLTIDDRDVLDGITRDKDGNANPSSFGRYILRIGDCTVPISPGAISVTKTSQAEAVNTLRTRSSLKTKSGYSHEEITVVLYFVGETQINGYPYMPYPDTDPSLVYYRNGLRPLIAQFMKAPFLPIENELINNVYKIYSVCLQDLQVSSVEGFPNCMQAILTLLPFDHTVYMFQEEYFEGTFCWPLFRWYYQQKMLKEHHTRLEEYIGNDLQLYKWKKDENTIAQSLYNPNNALIFDLPQESFLKKRKEAIYELYEKKAPDIVGNDLSHNYIETQESEGYQAFAGYSQFTAFSTYKNYYNKQDFPFLYDGDKFTFDKSGSGLNIILQQARDSKVNLEEMGWSDQKYNIVVALATFLTLFTNTYQYNRRIVFKINGFTKATLENAFWFLEQESTSKIEVTGNEDFGKWGRSDIYTDSVQTIKQMYEIWNCEGATAEIFGLDRDNTTDTIGGASFVIGAILFGVGAALAGVPFLGATLMWAGGIAATGGGITFFIDEALDAHESGELANKPGVNNIFTRAVLNTQDDNFYKQFVWEEEYPTTASADFWSLVDKYGGLHAIKILNHESTFVNKYSEDPNMSVIQNNTLLLAPTALITDRTTESILASESAAQAYKDQIAQWQQLAHCSEADIPTERFVVPDIFVQNCVVAINNRFVPLQTQKLETPTFQFLGGSDVVMHMIFQTKSREALRTLYDAMKRSQYLSREYRIAITGGVLNFHHPMLKLFGVKSALIENIQIDTDPDSAESFIVSLDLVSFDKTQKQRETLDKDGFGMTFDDVNTWKAYQRMKRTEQGFEYGNVDLTLKEAELYPDLQLPTYKEVNEFLKTHPITDRVGLVFNRLPNTTNCKYVDPDFYIRSEETMRDFIESQLNSGNRGGIVLQDESGNAMISQNPSLENQFTQQENTLKGYAAKGPAGPDIVCNEATEEAIKNTIQLMTVMDGVNAATELSANAYAVQKGKSMVDNNNSTEEQAEVDQILANAASYLPVVHNELTSYENSETGEQVSIKNATKLQIDCGAIEDALNLTHWFNKTEEEEAWKELKTKTISIYAIDESGLLDYSFNSTLKRKDGGRVDDGNSGLKLLGQRQWIGELDKGNKRENSSRYQTYQYKCSNTLNGKKTFTNTLVSLYAFLYLIENIGVVELNQNSSTSENYYIIMGEHSKGNMETALSENVDSGNVVFSGSNIVILERCIDNILGILAYAPQLNPTGDGANDDKDYIPLQELITGKYNFKKKFEEAGIFVYKKGEETTMSPSAATTLKSTLNKYTNIPEDTTKQYTTLNEENIINKITAKEACDKYEELIRNRDIKGIKFNQTNFNNLTYFKYVWSNPTTFFGDDESKFIEQTKVSWEGGTFTVYDMSSVSGDITQDSRWYIVGEKKVPVLIKGKNETYQHQQTFRIRTILIDPSNRDISENQWLSHGMFGLLSLLLNYWIGTQRTEGNKYDVKDLIDAEGFNISTFLVADLSNQERVNFIENNWDDLSSGASSIASIASSYGQQVNSADKLIDIVKSSGELIGEWSLNKAADTAYAKLNNIIGSYREKDVNVISEQVDENEKAQKQSVKARQDMNVIVESVADRLNSNLNVCQQEELLRTAFNDLLKYDCRGRLVRAFPSFHMFIIDEGTDGVWYSMWDNFYAYNSIISIDIYKDKRIIADTAVIRMTNIYKNLSSLDTELSYDDYEYSFADYFSSKHGEYVANLWNTALNIPDLDLLRAQQARVSSIVLRPGARIHLRMGYGADAYNLPVVFNGVITECSTDEIMSIAAQGDGVELTNKIQCPTNKTTDPGAFESPLEPRMIIGDMMTNRGSFFKNLISYASNDLWYSKNPLGISHFGNKEEIRGVTGWQNAPIIFGWWSRITQHETETNNYGPALMNVYAGGDARSLSKWEYTDFSKRNEGFSGENFKWKWNFLSSEEENKLPEARIYMFDMTPNDVCQMLAACCPDYICSVVPFELRSTLFFGRPHWGCATEYSYMYQFNSDYQNVVRDPVGYVRRSFSQQRMYNSYTDIISNQVSASSELMKTNIIGIYNEKNGAKQTATVSVDTDLDDDCQTTGFVHLPLKADMIGYNYFHQGKYAEVAAISELKNLTENMYQGEITVLGDPSVKPHDTMYMEDSFNDMYGMSTVRAVHHMFSADTGMITSIQPALVAVADDTQYIDSILWKTKICSSATGAVAALMYKSGIWQKLLMVGPIGQRVKQYGKGAVELVFRDSYKSFTNDDVVKTMIDLDPDNISEAFQFRDQNGALTKIDDNAKILANKIDDRVAVTKFLSENPLPIDGDAKSEAEFLEKLKKEFLTTDANGNTTSKLKTIKINDNGTFNLEDISRYALTDEEVLKVRNLNLKQVELQEELVQQVKELKKVNGSIDKILEDKFITTNQVDEVLDSTTGKKIKVKNEMLELKKGQIKELEELADAIDDDGLRNVVKTIKAEGSGNKISANKFKEVLENIKRKNGTEFAKILDDIDYDFLKHAGAVQEATSKFTAQGLKWADKMDNWDEAIKLFHNANGKGISIKKLFSKTTWASAKNIVSSVDNVKDIAKASKSIASSLGGLCRTVGTAVAPGLGTIAGIAIDVVIDIATEAAFEYYFRWKRRRQALILSPMLYRKKPFVAGIDGHQGSVLGDQPSKADMIFMGQGAWGTPFKMLNWITGSDIDYGNTSLSQIYDDWYATIEPWDAADYEGSNSD